MAGLENLRLRIRSLFGDSYLAKIIMGITCMRNAFEQSLVGFDSDCEYLSNENR
jgi:hypothetical protein